jgi:chain length determinant protein tyrosine kinase EpsG
LDLERHLDLAVRGLIADPDAGSDRSRAIGSILMAEGRLSSEQIEQIQQFANERSLRFGDAAVLLKLLTPYDVAVALARQFNYPTLPRGGEGGVHDDVIVAHNPAHEQAESMRVLRSQLMLRWFPTATRKALAIISPERGEGRSLLAANLATAFAQIDLRTLLIDTDLRQPRQHEMFNLSNEAGLSEVLTGRAGRQVVQRVHPQLRLFVLTAGAVPPNPQELLSRPLFQLVLDRLIGQFDTVILDTPAASEAADAQILSAFAGAALILARRNRTRSAQLAGIMETLRQTGVNVVGSVIFDH